MSVNSSDESKIKTNLGNIGNYIEKIDGQCGVSEETSFWDFFTKTIPEFFASFRPTAERIKEINSKMDAIIGLKSVQENTKSGSHELLHKIKNKGFSDFIEKEMIDPVNSIKKIEYSLSYINLLYQNRSEYKDIDRAKIRPEIHQMLNSVERFVNRHNYEELYDSTESKMIKLGREFVKKQNDSLQLAKEEGFQLDVDQSNAPDATRAPLQTRNPFDQVPLKFSKDFLLRMEGALNPINKKEGTKLEDVDALASKLDVYQKFESDLAEWNQSAKGLPDDLKRMLASEAIPYIQQTLEGLNFSDRDKSHLEKCIVQLNKLNDRKRLAAKLAFEAFIEDIGPKLIHSQNIEADIKTDPLIDNYKNYLSDRDLNDALKEEIIGQVEKKMLSICKIINGGLKNDARSLKLLTTRTMSENFEALRNVPKTVEAYVTEKKKRELLHKINPDVSPELNGGEINPLSDTEISKLPVMQNYFSLLDKLFQEKTKTADQVKKVKGRLLVEARYLYKELQANKLISSELEERINKISKVNENLRTIFSRLREESGKATSHKIILSEAVEYSSEKEQEKSRRDLAHKLNEFVNLKVGGDPIQKLGSRQEDIDGLPLMFNYARELKKRISVGELTIDRAEELTNRVRVEIRELYEGLQGGFEITADVKKRVEAIASVKTFIDQFCKTFAEAKNNSEEESLFDKFLDLF